MVDIHTHVIPGLDDGAPDIETALGMLEIAASEGIKHLIATPHYISGERENSLSEVRSRYEELLEAAGSKGLDITIYLGSEVFLTPELPDLVRDGRVSSLGGSSYILIEFPMASIPVYARDVIFRLRLMDYVPVIAHPERNRLMARDPNLLYDFLEQGALSQVNSTSITGVYGRTVKEAALTILRHDMAHFVASDAHTCGGRAPRLRGAREVLLKELGRERTDALFEYNGLAVLTGGTVDAGEPERVRKGSFFSFALPFRKSNAKRR